MNATPETAPSPEYVTLSTGIEQGTFDGYSVRVRDNNSGEILHTAAGEVHTLEALTSIVSAASQYRPGTSTVELLVSNSKTGDVRSVNPDIVTHPILLGLPEEALAQGVDGYALDFIDAQGSIEEGGRGELPAMGSATLESVQVIAQAGSKHARESGKQVKLRVFNSKTGLERDVHVIDG